MKNYFSLSEFHKPEIALLSDVKEKIEKYHIPELNKVREKLKSPIIISRHSGYRPRWYELQKGRSGNSEHCYKGKGAVDITCESSRFGELWELMVDSAYTRVCLYVNNNFIHCDFKEVERKQIFHCIDGKTWERVG